MSEQQPGGRSTTSGGRSSPNVRRGFELYAPGSRGAAARRAEAASGGGDGHDTTRGRALWEDERESARAPKGDKEWKRDKWEEGDDPGVRAAAPRGRGGVAGRRSPPAPAAVEQARGGSVVGNDTSRSVAAKSAAGGAEEPSGEQYEDISRRVEEEVVAKLARAQMMGMMLKAHRQQEQAAERRRGGGRRDGGVGGGGGSRRSRGGGGTEASAPRQVLQRHVNESGRPSGSGTGGRRSTADQGGVLATAAAASRRPVVVGRDVRITGAPSQRREPTSQYVEGGMSSAAPEEQGGRTSSTSLTGVRDAPQPAGLLKVSLAELSAGTPVRLSNDTQPEDLGADPESMDVEEAYALVGKIEKQHKMLIEELRGEIGLLSRSRGVAEVASGPSAVAAASVAAAIASRGGGQAAPGAALYGKMTRVRGALSRALRSLVRRDAAFSLKKRLPNRLWMAHYRELEVVQQRLRQTVTSVNSAAGGGSGGGSGGTSQQRQQQQKQKKERQALLARLFLLIEEAERDIGGMVDAVELQIAASDVAKLSSIPDNGALIATATATANSPASHGSPAVSSDDGCRPVTGGGDGDDVDSAAGGLQGGSARGSDKDDGNDDLEDMSEEELGRQQALQTLLTSLGDLERYRGLHGDPSATGAGTGAGISSNVGGRGKRENWARAQELYLRALRADASSGKVWNQMALLASCRQDNLEAFYAYLRGLCAATPYTAGRESLLVLHEKCKARLSTLREATALDALGFEEHQARFRLYLLGACGTCLSRVDLGTFDGYLALSERHMVSCVQLYLMQPNAEVEGVVAGGLSGTVKPGGKHGLEGTLARAIVLCVCTASASFEAWRSRGMKGGSWTEDAATSRAVCLCLSLAGSLAGLHRKTSKRGWERVTAAGVGVFLDWLVCRPQFGEGLRGTRSDDFQHVMARVVEFANGVIRSTTTTTTAAAAAATTTTAATNTTSIGNASGGRRRGLVVEISASGEKTSPVQSSARSRGGAREVDPDSVLWEDEECRGLPALAAGSERRAAKAKKRARKAFLSQHHHHHEEHPVPISSSAASSTNGTRGAASSGGGGPAGGNYKRIGKSSSSGAGPSRSKSLAAGADESSSNSGGSGGSAGADVDVDHRDHGHYNHPGTARRRPSLPVATAAEAWKVRVARIRQQVEFCVERGWIARGNRPGTYTLPKPPSRFRYGSPRGETDDGDEAFSLEEQHVGGGSGGGGEALASHHSGGDGVFATFTNEPEATARRGNERVGVGVAGSCAVSRGGGTLWMGTDEQVSGSGRGVGVAGVGGNSTNRGARRGAGRQPRVPLVPPGQHRELVVSPTTKMTMMHGGGGGGGATPPALLSPTKGLSEMIPTVVTTPSVLSPPGLPPIPAASDNNHHRFIGDGGGGGGVAAEAEAVAVAEALSSLHLELQTQENGSNGNVNYYANGENNGEVAAYYLPSRPLPIPPSAQQQQPPPQPQHQEKSQRAALSAGDTGFRGKGEGIAGPTGEEGAAAAADDGDRRHSPVAAEGLLSYENILLSPSGGDVSSRSPPYNLHHHRAGYPVAANQGAIPGGRGLTDHTGAALDSSGLVGREFGAAAGRTSARTEDVGDRGEALAFATGGGAFSSGNNGHVDVNSSSNNNSLLLPESLLGIVLAGLGSADENLCAYCCATLNPAASQCAVCGTPASQPQPPATAVQAAAGATTTSPPQALPMVATGTTTTTTAVARGGGEGGRGLFYSSSADAPALLPAAPPLPNEGGLYGAERGVGGRGADAGGMSVPVSMLAVKVTPIMPATVVAATTVDLGVLPPGARGTSAAATAGEGGGGALPAGVLAVNNLAEVMASSQRPKPQATTSGGGGRDSRPRSSRDPHNPSTIARAGLGDGGAGRAGGVPSRRGAMFGWPRGAPRAALPLVVIDVPNVAMRHGLNKRFSCKGVQMAIEYFRTAGHRVLGFLPDYYLDLKRTNGLERAKKLGVAEVKASRLPDNVQLLQRLVEDGLLVATPPQDYDDSYCIKYAMARDGYVVTNDLYRDHVKGIEGRKKADAARRWIKSHSISYTFVGDEFFPNPDFSFHQDQSGGGGAA